MPRKTRWTRVGAPRGDAYDRRFQQLAASGFDVHGEATFVASLLPGAASGAVAGAGAAPVAGAVLDAGCGTGRVAIELARRGFDVVGVDVDTAMLEAAHRKAPALAWVHADLATFDLDRRFDVVVMAGNVLLFVAPGTEADVIGRLGAHLQPGGRLVAGFSLGGGLTVADYDEMARAAGLALESRFATWERAPFLAGGDYAVSVHRG